jgi:hypothetical protein
VALRFGAAWLGVRLDPSGASSGAGEGEADRRPEVMPTAAVKAVWDHLDTTSCCQMTTQKNPAATTIHQI